MYEFTMGGAWFKWSALDRRSKQLAAVSMVAAALAALPAMRAGGEHGYRLGYRLGSLLAGGGGAAPPMPAGATPAWMLWTMLAGALVSAAAWWRFSVRQDELFNRVQNWALGMAGAWGAALLFCWTVAAAALDAPAPSPTAAGLVVLGLLYACWFAAVRRWA